MIIIDGSSGESGGQILRTSLSLSALTGKEFEIINIRKNRPEQGLKEQHLQAVNSIKKLCGAEVIGNELNSRKLIFKPGKITKKLLRIKVRTAGSTALILQTILLASLNNDLRVKIEGGGSWNLHAPSILYLQEVFLELLKLNCRIDVTREGFYPKGGAKIEANIKKTKMDEINLVESGNLNEINIFSIAAEDLRKANVHKRQEITAANLIGKEFPEVKINNNAKCVNSICAGSGVLCKARFDNTILGYDVVGERGKQSEKIGKEAANGLLKNIHSEGCVDNFMIDQILPYLAIFKGKVKFNELTDHAKTNMDVIRKFLDVKFEIKNKIIEVK